MYVPHLMIKVNTSYTAEQNIKGISNTKGTLIMTSTTLPEKKSNHKLKINSNKTTHITDTLHMKQKINHHLCTQTYIFFIFY